MSFLNKYQYQWCLISPLKKYFLLLCVVFLQIIYLYSCVFYAKDIDFSKVSFLNWILASFQDISTAVHGFPMIYCLFLVMLFKDNQINELIIQRFNSSKDVKLNKLVIIISSAFYFVLSIDFVSILFSYFPFGKFFYATKEGSDFFFRNVNQHLFLDYSLIIQIIYSSVLSFFYFMLLGLLFWGTTTLAKKKSIGFIVTIIFIFVQAFIYKKQSKLSFIWPINHYILYANQKVMIPFISDFIYWSFLITVLTVLVWYIDNRKGVSY